jgi:hypothetical protein
LGERDAALARTEIVARRTQNSGDPGVTDRIV